MRKVPFYTKQGCIPACELYIDTKNASKANYVKQFLIEHLAIQRQVYMQGDSALLLLLNGHSSYEVFRRLGTVYTCRIGAVQSPNQQRSLYNETNKRSTNCLTGSGVCKNRSPQSCLLHLQVFPSSLKVAVQFFKDIIADAVKRQFEGTCLWLMIKGFLQWEKLSGRGTRRVKWDVSCAILGDACQWSMTLVSW